MKKPIKCFACTKPGLKFNHSPAGRAKSRRLRKPEVHLVRVKTPGIKFKEIPVPKWKMEMILDVIFGGDSMEVVTLALLVPRIGLIRKRVSI